MPNHRQIDADPFTVPPFAHSAKIGRNCNAPAPKRKPRPGLFARLAARLKASWSVK